MMSTLEFGIWFSLDTWLDTWLLWHHHLFYYYVIYNSKSQRIHDFRGLVDKWSVDAVVWLFCTDNRLQVMHALQILVWKYHGICAPFGFWFDGHEAGYLFVYCFFDMGMWGFLSSCCKEALLLEDDLNNKRIVVLPTGSWFNGEVNKILRVLCCLCDPSHLNGMRI